MIPPLSYILIPAFTAFFSAILGTLLATFVIPRFQHYFWKRQRREELRFAVATEVNRLAAEFIMSYLGKDMPADIPALGLTFYQLWQAAAGQVKDLFSPSTYQLFEKMERIIFISPLISTQELEDRLPRLTDFKQARETALQAFYKEIGIL
jgi:hypothetical protein